MILRLVAEGKATLSNCAANPHSKRLKTWKDFTNFNVADSARENLAQGGTIVDFHFHPAGTGKTRLFFEAGPGAVNLPAVNFFTDGEEGRPTAVIGTG